jgi:desulfoferrodoxin (superoxide reductase-like protein)
MDPEISYTLVDNKITFRAKHFAKYVYIYSDNECLQLSDNFFDLEPDVPYTVTMKEKKKFSFMSYTDLTTTNIQLNN